MSVRTPNFLDSVHRAPTAAALGLDLRLDRSNPERNARLLSSLRRPVVETGATT